MHSVIVDNGCVSGVLDFKNESLSSRIHEFGTAQFVLKRPMCNHTNRLHLTLGLLCTFAEIPFLHHVQGNRMRTNWGAALCVCCEKLSIEIMFTPVENRAKPQP